MWHRWKLVRTDGTPTKDFIESNQLLFKSGSSYNSLYYKEDKYEFVLLQSGAVGFIYGFKEFYGPFFEIIDHKGWGVKFNAD